MATLIDIIMNQMSDQVLGQMSQQLGADEGQTRNAVAASLPTILAGLARNANSQGGASALIAALDRDHDGNIMDDLPGFLQGMMTGTSQAGQVPTASSLSQAKTGKTVDGAGILRHTLGNKRSTIEDAVGRTSGLGAEKSGRLLEMLAPIVMGSLGKVKRERSLDSGGLSDLLQQNRRAITSNNRSQGQTMDIITNILDADNDGNVLDDLTGMLGKFMRRG